MLLFPRWNGKKAARVYSIDIASGEHFASKESVKNIEEIMVVEEQGRDRSMIFKESGVLDFGLLISSN